MPIDHPLTQAAQGGIDASNERLLQRHQRQLDYLHENFAPEGIDIEKVIEELMAFDVSAPSWALGTGGTRFGRFSEPGEPATLEQKMVDLTALRMFMGSTKSVSLHIPWDIPDDPDALRATAAAAGLDIATVNSNTFQDQADQPHSYKFGSMSHTDPAVRRQAVEHNIQCIEIGQKLGSRYLSIWLPDGANHPGQQHMRRAADRTIDSLRQVYESLPEDWVMYTEHKPFEPAFYSTVVSDWGASLMIAREVGERCLCLVDLGHHLQGCNIEQVVAYLLRVGRLGGFHFNDAKYADDDLTTGSLRPYMLFLIFCELVQGRRDPDVANPPWTYMIDESHNVKDPLEDLMQSVDAIQLALTQALCVDYTKLEAAQDANDPVAAQAALQHAYRTDVRPLVREARRRLGSALEPVDAFRACAYRRLAAEQRGMARATGL